MDHAHGRGRPTADEFRSDALRCRRTSRPRGPARLDLRPRARRGRPPRTARSPARGCTLVLYARENRRQAAATDASTMRKRRTAARTVVKPTPVAQRVHEKPAICGGFLKRMKGLEPSTFCMASRRSSQLSYIREGGKYSRVPPFSRRVSGAEPRLSRRAPLDERRGHPGRIRRVIEPSGIRVREVEDRPGHRSAEVAKRLPRVASVALRLDAVRVVAGVVAACEQLDACILYTSPSPRDGLLSRMPSSA